MFGSYRHKPNTIFLGEQGRSELGFASLVYLQLQFVNLAVGKLNTLCNAVVIYSNIEGAALTVGESTDILEP